MIASASYSPVSVPEATSNPNHPLIRWGEAHGAPSITALAELLDVSRPRLSQIVTRKHRPSAELALVIHQVTKIPIEDLLSLTSAEVKAGVRAAWEKPKRRKNK